MKLSMKKVFAILLAMVMVLGLTACGGANNASTPAGTEPAGSSAEATTKDNNPEWPTKTITWIVPYSAGGNADNITRLLQPYLEAELGVSINVVNKPGSSGELGTQEVADADPDGYTIGIINSPDIQISCIVNQDYEVDFHKSLNYIATFTATPISLYAPTGCEWDTRDKFVAYSKANPGKLAIGEGGIGHRVLLASVSDYFGIELNTVNFNSVADVTTAAGGGHIDVASAGNQVIANFTKFGWQPIAWGGEKKCEQFPDCPLFTDMGLFADFMGVMSMIITPKDTPDYINQKLVEICKKLSQNPEIQKKLEAINCVYSFTCGEDLSKKAAGYYDTIADLCERYRDKIILNN